jgi:hypothetical protein
MNKFCSTQKTQGSPLWIPYNPWKCSKLIAFGKCPAGLATKGQCGQEVTGHFKNCPTTLTTTEPLATLIGHFVAEFERCPSGRIADPAGSGASPDFDHRHGPQKIRRLLLGSRTVHLRITRARSRRMSNHRLSTRVQYPHRQFGYCPDAMEGSRSWMECTIGGLATAIDLVSQNLHDSGSCHECHQRYYQLQSRQIG